MTGSLEIVVCCPCCCVEFLCQAVFVFREGFLAMGTDHVDLHLDVCDYYGDDILYCMMAPQELEEVIGGSVWYWWRVERLYVWEQVIGNS